MNYNLLITELETELNYQRKMLKMYEKEQKKLKEYKECHLVRNKKRKQFYYYLKKPTLKKEQYLGRESNPIVKAVQQYKYYDKAIEIANMNINTLEYLLANYADTESESIRAQLPKCYQSANIPVESEHSKTAEEWLADMQRIKDSVKPYKPENLKHTALNGIKMRTKVEVIIADFLILHNIPFIYELPVDTPLGLVVPDFAIYDEATGQVFFWEHMGMLYNEGYYSDQYIKLKKYASIDYIPGINLIITVDDDKGNFNTQVLDRIVNSYFSKPA